MYYRYYRVFVNGNVLYRVAASAAEIREAAEREGWAGLIDVIEPVRL